MGQCKFFTYPYIFIFLFCRSLPQQGPFKTTELVDDEYDESGMGKHLFPRYVKNNDYYREMVILHCFVYSPVYCGVLFSLNALRPSNLSFVGITC